MKRKFISFILSLSMAVSLAAVMPLTAHAAITTTINKSTELLAGGTISVANKYSAGTIRVLFGASLTLNNVKINGLSTGNTSMFGFYGALNIEDGVVLTGNYKSNGLGGAIYIYDTGTVNMYGGTMTGLPEGSEAEISDGNDAVSGAVNGKMLYANINNIITATTIDGVEYTGTYNETDAAWSLGKATEVSDPVFSMLADTGYYSEAKASADKEGIIAFNSVFENFDECKDNVTSYGMYIYKQGGEVKLEKNSIEELEQEFGKFYATVEGISADNFGTMFTAMPYTVWGELLITGSPCIFTVNDGGKWLGAKSE